MRSPRLQRTWRPALRAAALSGLALLAMGAHAAEADVQDIDDTWRAQIQKDKIKQHQFEARNQATGGEAGKCGQVDIGNDQAQRGSKPISARDKTVIVLGPVINVAKCR